MTTASEEGTEDQVSPLDLSDDDFNDLNFDDLPASDDASSESTTTITTEEGDTDGTGDGAGDGTDSDGKSDGSDAGTNGDDGNLDDPNNKSGADESGAGNSGEDDSAGAGDEGSGSAGGAATDGSDGSSGESGKTSGDDSKGKGKSVSEKSEINYKEEYEKLLAPFKANSKDMQVDSIEDARTLMQMGANYNKKMAGLKPNLKLIKMLSNNNLLDESKLSFLIDLDKKDPEAIKKFIKDSGIDPVTLDLESESGYKPKPYTVNDNEIDLDGVLGEIQDTPSFNETIDIISNKWDAPSKQILLENPNVIKTINEHVASGIYAKITAAVEKKRMLGGLNGQSDLEAYKEIGDAMNANGDFDQPIRNKTDADKTNTSESNKTVDKKLLDRKKAASSTKAAGSSKSKEDFNPLGMSDEEFNKIASSKYM